MDTGFEALRDHIASMGKVVVCFSGGLDSTALMDICKKTLGDDAIAFYLSTPMESKLTTSMVDRISGHLGIDVIRRVMDDRLSGIVLQNTADRCYLCKKTIYSEALDLAHELGIKHVLCGDNMDDDPNDRPGMRAGKELGVESPFCDMGIGRREIESYVNSLALPFPMVKETCLLMRIPIGVEADDILLERINRFESGIRLATGAELIRARLKEGTIMVQTVENSIATLLEHVSEIEDVCKKEGFGAEIVRTGYTG
jgi:uncharacterized protein